MKIQNLRVKTISKYLFKLNNRDTSKWFMGVYLMPSLLNWNKKVFLYLHFSDFWYIFDRIKINGIQFVRFLLGMKDSGK